METVREKKATRVAHWLEEQKGLLDNSEITSRLSSFHEGIKALTVRIVDKQAFLRLDADLGRFFVNKLASFYDILFFDENGKVFYSVKMEADFRTSFVDGPYSRTKLAELIQKQPRTTAFVDFEFYGASDEAAAFHVLPIILDDEYAGAIALQVSTNRINKLLTDRSGLGRTGEAYLVNDRRLMLTDSRFINEDTVLSKQIDTRAIRRMETGMGNEIIDDYRGIRVLSSYRSLKVGRSVWRLLVEKDESEVLTEYYLRNGDSLFPRLVEAIRTSTRSALEKGRDTHTSDYEKSRRVDVGELQRSDNRNALFTPGVATCTAVLAYRDRHEFAYLAHLSPVDESYDLSDATQGILGEKSTDLISLMLRRIRHFEIRPHELAALRFMIVAPHDDSLKGVLAKLFADGVSLSQVRAAILPEVRYASVFYDAEEETAKSYWASDQDPPGLFSDLGRLPALSEFVQKM